MRTHSEDKSIMLRKEEISNVFYGEEELAKGMALHISNRFKPGDGGQTITHA
ncbi:MAG: hypothetical protein HY254_01735 [Burkholderiales bacterium]|nr:hypothetical protein [Burkholderiales bacterium]